MFQVINLFLPRVTNAKLHMGRLKYWANFRKIRKMPHEDDEPEVIQPVIASTEPESEAEIEPEEVDEDMIEPEAEIAVYAQKPPEIIPPPEESDEDTPIPVEEEIIEPTITPSVHKTPIDEDEIEPEDEIVAHAAPVVEDEIKPDSEAVAYAEVPEPELDESDMAFDFNLYNAQLKKPGQYFLRLAVRSSREDKDYSEVQAQKNDEGKYPFTPEVSTDSEVQEEPMSDIKYKDHQWTFYLPQGIFFFCLNIKLLS